MRAVCRFLAVAIAWTGVTGTGAAAADLERWRVPVAGHVHDPWAERAVADGPSVPSPVKPRASSCADDALVRDDVLRALSWRLEQGVSWKHRLYASFPSRGSGRSGPWPAPESSRKRTSDSAAAFDGDVAYGRHATRELMDTAGVPALRQVLDADASAVELQAACALALAKATTSDEDAARLRSFAAAHARSPDGFVAATSVIALGALARGGRQPTCTARALDDVRRWLRASAASPELRAEVRGLALLALGLLAASPTAAQPFDDGEFLLAWARCAADPVTRGDAWMSLSVMPADRRPPATLARLRDAADVALADAGAGRDLASAGADVMMALGSMGAPSDAATLLRAARMPHGDAGVRRAAWPALVALSARAPQADIAAVVLACRAAWPAVADAATEAARILGTGDLVAAWLDADRARACGETTAAEGRSAEVLARERVQMLAVAEDVLDLVDDSHLGRRMAAGVALGAILDAIGDRAIHEECWRMRVRGLEALVDRVGAVGGEELVVAARSLGRAQVAMPYRAVTGWPHPRSSLAWTAAVGLSRGYESETAPLLPLVLGESLAASGEPAFASRLAASATSDATQSLYGSIANLAGCASPAAVRARWIHVLGEVGTARDVPRLVGWLLDEREPLEVRAAAAAALGVVADLQIASSWSRFGAPLEVGAMSAARERALRAW